MEDKLLSLIPIGRENAVHQNVLCNMMGVSTCVLKSLIKKLRMSGHAIVSDTDGYWISEDTQEIADFIARMSKQATSRFMSIKALKGMCNEIDGQMSIEGIEE